MPADAVAFTPTPQAAEAILADLDDCSLSFNDLAKKYGTNTEALALWLTTDPVKDRIQTSLDAMALRIRSVATSRLPAALDAVRRIVLRYDQHFPEPPLDPTSPDYRTEREHRRRRDESARRACVLLLRLSNFFSPTKPQPRRELLPLHAPAQRAQPATPFASTAALTTEQILQSFGRSNSDHKPPRPDLSEPPATNTVPPPPSRPTTSLKPSPAPSLVSVHSPSTPSSPSSSPSSSAALTTPARPAPTAHPVSSEQPSFSSPPSSAPSAISPPPSTYARPRQRFKRRRQLSG